jgi:hypothetical protein
MSIFGTESIDTFAPGLSQGPTSTLSVDVVINKADPGVILQGSEASGRQCEIREVAGVLYIVNNATFSVAGNTWSCVNTASEADGMRMDASGNWQKITHVATAGTWASGSWTVVDAMDVSGNILAPAIGPASGQIHTLPAVTSDTIALLAAAQSLSNKTLVAAILSGTVTGTYTLGGTPSLGATLLPSVDATDSLGSLALRFLNAFFSGSVSFGAAPAGAGVGSFGVVRLSNATGIAGRNSGNTGDIWAFTVASDNNNYFSTGSLAGSVTSNAILAGVFGSALATNATVGWPYMPYSSGAPTGTPASLPTGFAPFQWDDTNKGMKVYSPGSAAWLSVGSTPTVVIKTGSKAGAYSNINNATSFIDLDATNLTYTVTVPTGQKLLIFAKMSALNNSSSDRVTTAMRIFMDGTTQIGGATQHTQQTNDGAHHSVNTSFTGDGSSHTFKLQAWMSGSNENCSIFNDATYYPDMLFILTPAN